MQKDCEWMWDKGEIATVNPANWSGSMELEDAKKVLQKLIDEKKETRKVRVKIPSGFRTKEQTLPLDGAVQYIDKHILKFKLVGKNVEYSYDRGALETGFFWNWTGPRSFDKCLEELEKEKGKDWVKAGKKGEGGFRVKVPSGFLTQEQICKDVHEAIAYVKKCSPNEAKNDAAAHLGDLNEALEVRKAKVAAVESALNEVVDKSPALGFQIKVEEAKKSRQRGRGRMREEKGGRSKVARISKTKGGCRSCFVNLDANVLRQRRQEPEVRHQFGTGQLVE